MQIEFIDHTNDELSAMQGLSRDGLYGDGFFTTGTIKIGEIQHWDYHLERVLFSASRLYFVDFSLEFFRASIEKLVENVAQAAFRISITRCQKSRGYGISGSALSLCRLNLFPLPPSRIQYCDLVIANTPISVNPYFAGIKHLNRLDSVLASSEIRDENQEVLMCNGELVISGSKCNLFLLINGQWHTPLIDLAGVNGITRLRILKMMANKGIHCHKSRVRRNELINVEAAFVCNSLIGIWPATRIQGKILDTLPSIKLQQFLEKGGC